MLCASRVLCGVRTVSARAAIVLAGALVAVVLSNALGLVSVVGYTRIHTSASGVSSAEFLQFNATVPIWVEPGDTVVADFDLDIQAGAVALRLWHSFQNQLVDTRAAKQSTTTGGAGRAELRVERAGWYTPAAWATIDTGGRMSEYCRERWRRGLLAAATPDAACKRYAVYGTVQWRIERGG